MTATAAPPVLLCCQLQNCIKLFVGWTVGLPMPLLLANEARSKPAGVAERAVFLGIGGRYERGAVKAIDSVASGELHALCLEIGDFLLRQEGLGDVEWELLPVAARRKPARLLLSVSRVWKSQRVDKQLFVRRGVCE